MVYLISLICCILYAISQYSSMNSYWTTSVVKLLVFGVVPLLFLICRKKLRDILRLGNKKSLKIPAFLGIGCMIFIWLGYGLLHSFFNSEQILAGLSAQSITKTVYPFVFLHIVLVNSFLEEFFFRGFLFRNLYQMGHKTTAYLFSSVLFSVYHISIFQSWFSVPVVLLCLAGLVLAGLFFCETDRRCDHIYGGWLIHLGANVGINVIGACLFYLA